MSRERVVLDTNVIIRHGATELARRGLLSAVVLQEITAGAADRDEVRAWGALGTTMDSQGKLLVPTAEDWYEAGKVLNSLFRGVRSHRERDRLGISNTSSSGWCGTC